MARRPVLSAECAGCKAKDAVIAELMKLVQRGTGSTPYQPYQNVPIDRSYADRCPCNPANGGSGVCGCINGAPRVTC